MKICLHPLFFLLPAILPWIPGCLSESRISTQLKRIETAIDEKGNPDTLFFDTDATYRIPFDTVIKFKELHFVADLETIGIGGKYEVFSDADLTLTLQYDTLAGVVRGFIMRQPLTVRGFTYLHKREEIRFRQLPAKKDTAQVVEIAKGEVVDWLHPRPGWGFVAVFMALFLGGAWWLDKRFFR